MHISTYRMGVLHSDRLISVETHGRTIWHRPSRRCWEMSMRPRRPLNARLSLVRRNRMKARRKALLELVTESAVKNFFTTAAYGKQYRPNHQAALVFSGIIVAPRWAAASCVCLFSPMALTGKPHRKRLPAWCLPRADCQSPTLPSQNTRASDQVAS